MKTVQPITGRKTGELCRLLEERGIGDREIQDFLIQRPDDLVNYIRGLMVNPEAITPPMKALCGSLAKIYKLNPYAFEGCKQEWYYPRGWRIPSLTIQAERLKQTITGFVPCFPDVGEIMIPEGADEIALMPTLTSLGKFWGVDNPIDAGYCQLVDRIAEVFKRDRKDGFELSLRTKYVRIQAEVKEMIISLEKDAEQLGYNCLAPPISFGQFHAGLSPRNSRWTAFYDGQLPLGAVYVGCLLLAMPDRLTDWGQMHVSCPGDEYDASYDKNRRGQWTECPAWTFYPAIPGSAPPRIILKEESSRHSSPLSGSAVAFPPLK